MRFLLDNDVDATVATLIRRAGYKCWTAQELGIPDASDNEIAIAADERDAYCITHDREFTTRVRERCFNSHVHLACAQPDAVEVVTRHIQEIVRILSWNKFVVLRVHLETVETHYARWS